MTPNAQRGFMLLAAALVALLVLLANELNDGTDTLTQMATAVLVLDGGLGAVLLARGLVRH
jgi:hypothetical protein